MSQLPSAKPELRGMSARICGNASSHRPPGFQYRVAARGFPATRMHTLAPFQVDLPSRVLPGSRLGHAGRHIRPSNQEILYQINECTKYEWVPTYLTEDSRGTADVYAASISREA